MPSPLHVRHGPPRTAETGKPPEFDLLKADLRDLVSAQSGAPTPVERTAGVQGAPVLGDCSRGGDDASEKV